MGLIRYLNTSTSETRVNPRGTFCFRSYDGLWFQAFGTQNSGGATVIKVYDSLHSETSFMISATSSGTFALCKIGEPTAYYQINSTSGTISIPYFGACMIIANRGNDFSVWMLDTWRVAKQILSGGSISDTTVTCNTNSILGCNNALVKTTRTSALCITVIR